MLTTFQELFSKLMLFLAIGGIVLSVLIALLRIAGRKLKALLGVGVLAVVMSAIALAATLRGGFLTLEEKEEQQEERRLLAASMVPTEDASGRDARPARPQSRAAQTPTDETIFAHWVHGVYLDGQRVVFDSDWVFPHGTNHLSSVEVMADGRILPDGMTADPIIAFAERLSLVPGISEFHCGRTASNTYAFVWTNARNGRIDGTPFSGTLELFRNGDAAITTNGVATLLPRILPFPHEGYGQDAEWVQANYTRLQALSPTLTNAEEILSVGYTNWVNAMVGIGLTNGLYKFTATFTEAPPETTLLTVGNFSVAVTNAGEYSFVMEKGSEYEFWTEPELESVDYRMADDLMSGESPAPMFLWNDWKLDRNWTIDGGWHWLNFPIWGYPGSCGWLPTLKGTPDVAHIGPDDFPKLFSAVVTDCPNPDDLIFEWSTSDENVNISTPHARQTMVTVDTMPSWRSLDLSVSTVIGDLYYSSCIQASYGMYETPQVELSITAPDVMFVDDDNRSERQYRVSFSVFSPTVTNGILRVVHSGSPDSICLETPFDTTPYVIEPLSVQVEAGVSVVQAFYLTCPRVGVGVFNATLTLPNGMVKSASLGYRVIDPQCALVSTEMDDRYTRHVNPSRLVVGEESVVRVFVDGTAFLPSDIKWNVVGPATVRADGWDLLVTPTTANSSVVVAAVCNEDVDQPIFAFPVVEKRRIPIRGFIVSSPEEEHVDPRALEEMVEWANIVFKQVGIEFYIVETRNNVGTQRQWNLTYTEWYESGETRKKRVSESAFSLLNTYDRGDCVEVYLTGEIKDVDSASVQPAGFWTPFGIVVQHDRYTALAHELGHALGLKDCYYSNNNKQLPNLKAPVDASLFVNHDLDFWGQDHGRGFYRKDETTENVIMRLLMFGYEGGGGSDIPGGAVNAFPEEDGDSDDVGQIAVGQAFLHSTNDEVYSR